MVRSKEANWTFDYKKIRILHYLLANRNGAFKKNFLDMSTKRQYGRISSSEIDTILSELLWDELILTQDVSNYTIYTISEKGRQFILEFKELSEKYSFKLFVIDALDEPTDAVSSRDDRLRGTSS